MAEIAGWEGKCGIMYETVINTFDQPAYALPLTAIPTPSWLSPELVDNNPLLINQPHDAHLYTTTGQKLYEVTGFETKFTATALQWLICNLANHAPGSLQGVNTVLVTTLEWTSSARVFLGYTVTLQFPANAAPGVGDNTSVALTGGRVTRIGISQDNSGSRISWDMLFHGKVDAGDTGAGNETMLYTAADNEIMPWDHTPSFPTWGGHIIKPVSWDLEITNSLPQVRTNEQTFDSVLQGRLGVTGNITLGYDEAMGAATIDVDALGRVALPLVFSFQAVNTTDGYVKIEFPAVITDQLDGPKEADDFYQMSFAFKGADDLVPTDWAVSTNAPETTKCAIA